MIACASLDFWIFIKSCKEVSLKKIHLVGQDVPKLSPNKPQVRNQIKIKIVLV